MAVGNGSTWGRSTADMTQLSVASSSSRGPLKKRNATPSPVGSSTTSPIRALSPPTRGSDLTTVSKAPSASSLFADSPKTKEPSLKGAHFLAHVDAADESFTDLGIPPSFFDAWRNGRAPSRSVEQLLSLAGAEAYDDDMFTAAAQEDSMTSQMLPNACTLDLEGVPTASDALLAYMADIQRRGGCASIEKIVLKGCRYVCGTP